MMVCGSITKYNNVVRVREETGRSQSGANSYQHNLTAFSDSPPKPLHTDNRPVNMMIFVLLESYSC